MHAESTTLPRPPQSDIVRRRAWLRRLAEADRHHPDPVRRAAARAVLAELRRRQAQEVPA